MFSVRFYLVNILKQLLKNPPATLLEYSQPNTQGTSCGAHEKSLSW